jgi:hypothetical protein
MREKSPSHARIPLHVTFIRDLPDITSHSLKNQHPCSRSWL